ncbi:MAG: transcriptional regulator [Firmicutes bacterium]|nr:transcriptional regulator [Bacillota bacterium]
MAVDKLVLRTRFNLPRARRQLFARPRLAARLSRLWDYPLTVVQAGPGYGKSTALVALLAGKQQSCFWYSLSEEDADSYLFIFHLIHAFRTSRPAVGIKSLAVLDETSGAARPWQPAVDALINEILDHLNEEAVLVLDDFHLLGDHQQIHKISEYFVEHLPARLHVVVSTRRRVQWDSLPRWRAKGEVLELSQEDLAFNQEEIASFFQDYYGFGLTGEQLEILLRRTEGWIIALEMAWQALQSGATLARMWDEPPASLRALFEYLAQEVLAKQELRVQKFLLATAIFKQLEPAACDDLCEIGDSAEVLGRLELQGLFTVSVGDGQYRYHHLFQDFLRRTAGKDEKMWREYHHRAVAFYLQGGNREEAVYYLLAGGEWHAAAALLEEITEELFRSGKPNPLIPLIDRLPEQILVEHPLLLLNRGDACRLASAFEEALRWYTLAEECFTRRQDKPGLSRALQGKALVYLDTVQPVQAETLLRAAVRLLGREDRWARAALLKLMAENKTNQGQVVLAERLWRAYRRLSHAALEDELDVRIYLRTGRLAAAQAALERRALEEESGDATSRAPRSHRETRLVLSLVYAFLGEAQKARECAKAGVRLGHQLGSPFVEAVAYMRLGHAQQLQLRPQQEETAGYYHRALELTDSLRIARGRAEPLMGLCLLHGFDGDMVLAEKAGREGMMIAERAGDQWLAGYNRIALGASYVINEGDARAHELLTGAATTFSACGDSYGLTVARLWLALLAHRRGEWEEFAAQVQPLLALTQTHGYDCLFTQITLFGPRDLKVAVPILLEARSRGIRADYASWLLAVLGLPKAEVHPGYSLYVQTLGTFRLWRGKEEVASKEWQREKARQLFQLLLTNRRQLLPREQIMEVLWPDLDPESAARDFKVAMNALNNVLEPGRPARSTPFYIFRQGSLYGLNLSAGYWLDVDEFESLIAKGGLLAEKNREEAMELYRRALGLYEGDYLQDCLYEDWSSTERERLLSLYFRTASKLAQLLADDGNYEECIPLCERILSRDNCWEEAYRLLMHCYHQQGRRHLALRAYERCAQRLEDEMGVAPTARTTELYRQIKA